MEAWIIWGIVGIIALVILIPYFLQFRKRQQEAIAKKREADALGITRPRAQFPFINQSLCIGCGSCVLACPENVLDVVWGKAAVVNGVRCVGHGHCEKICPVGAIEVGLGDIKQRDDIPVLDEHYQTTVPGIYIVGELSGLALIKNAIQQGRKAMEHIADQIKQHPTPENILDALIVGAGPAGTSAALVATQNNLNYLIIDAQDLGGTILQYPRRKLVMTEPVDIPLYGKLNRHEIEKEELLEIWQSIYRDFHLRLHRQERVVDVQKVGNWFTVKTTAKEYLTRFVVLAMGRRGNPRKLGVPGEQQAKVMYQLIDAQSYTHSNILVVGGGDSAVEAAIGLARQKGNRVTISYRKPQFFRIKQKNQERIGKLIQKGRITARFNSHVREIKAKSVVLEQDGKRIEIDNDYVFIFIGGEPPFAFLRKIGVKFGTDMATTPSTANVQNPIAR